VIANTRKKNVYCTNRGKKPNSLEKTHSDEIKNIISQSLKGKYVGDKCSSFKGYYITPFGNFASAREISESITNIGSGTVCAWCKHSSKIITKSMTGISKYLTENDLGKTFKEIGFYMEYK